MQIGYANPNPSFQPAMRLISMITNSNPAVVTTTFAHNYSTGTIVRLYVPTACGMTEANLQTGTISVTSATDFTINIDTTNYSGFISPPITPPPPPPIIPLPFPRINDQAMVVPIGEINSMLTASTRNVLPY